MKRILEVLGLLALLPAAACYSYRTIPMEEVRPDLEVRLRVTPEATGRVAQVVGYLTQDVHGTVVTLQQDAILLTVVTPTAPEARTIQRLYQRLDIPLSQVTEVQQRSLNRGRTYAAVAVGAAAGAVLTVWAFSGILGGSGQGNPPPVDNRLVAPQLLLPLGRIPLGR